MSNQAKYGGGLYVVLWAEQELIKTRGEDLQELGFLLINSTNFTGNGGELGSAVKIQGTSILQFQGQICPFPTAATVWFEGVQINTNTLTVEIMYYGAAALHVESVQWTVLKNTTVYNNMGGGIYMNNSNVVIAGDVTFKQNYGYYGGAMHLDCACDSTTFQSFLYLLNSSYTSMANNRALEYGGGIAISERCSDPSLCFLQRLQTDSLNDATVQGYKAIVEMRDNYAGIAGDDVYGASKLQCRLLADSMHDLTSKGSFFNSTFKILNKTMSSVSSIPYCVCICKQDSPKDYCLVNTEIEVFPGQQFILSAVTVGNHRGASPAVVQAQFIGLEEHAQLGTRQEAQKLGRTCGNLTYSIKASVSIINLHLTLQSVTQNINNSQVLPAIVSIKILPCPLGFIHTGDPPECECMPLLLQAGVTCDINTQAHVCPNGMWIGNFSGGIATHPHCPFDYCKPGTPIVNLSSQHEQCLYNRCGVLCGACQQGFSVSLGTSQCIKCSNVYLLLVFPFAVAGVALVFLLLKCNLTVASGTINGLIFYANIISINRTNFIPRSSVGSIVTFLSIFIAWLNLDLGIESCFINGLSTFGKACLQFLFPAYIWILVGLMIVGSRYSTRIAKLVGSNAVPVLSTLFLLSYAKLLRAVIDNVSFTTIAVPGGDMTAVWLMDGNLHFLETPHTYLFLLSVLATFAYIIPFSVLVLLAPCLQAKSNYRALHWITKLKPFLDVYQGPYKDRFRFWTGFMLLIRVILFITFASNVLGDPRLNLLAIVIALLALLIILWSTGHVYKSRLLHIIECFYLLNLGVFSAVTLFLATSDAPPHSQEQLFGVMVGSSFVIFCSIVLYHFYCLNTDMFMSCWSTGKKWMFPWVNKIGREVELTELEGGEHIASTSNNQPTVSVVEFDGLRESLLTDN